MKLFYVLLFMFVVSCGDKDTPNPADSGSGTAPEDVAPPENVISAEEAVAREDIFSI